VTTRLVVVVVVVVVVVGPAAPVLLGAYVSPDGRPLFLRFAHEMNDPYRYPWGPQNNDPADYVAAWRHLVTRFRLARADNVLWVFSPHVAYDGWEAYYPGDGYVDWTGTGTLNYGTATVWSQWQSFDDLYGRGREKLARFGKPVMITEIGSLATGGDRARWFGEALANLPGRYPEVKALVFFHVAQDSSTSYKALDWSFVNDRGVAAGIVRSAAGWDRPVRVAAHPGEP